MANGVFQSGGLGNAFGGFAQGFIQERNRRAEQKRKDDLAKAQLKVIEMNLEAGKVKVDATTRLTDLLTGNTVGEIEQLNAGAAPDSIGRKPIPEFEFTGGEPVGLSELLTNPESLAAAVQSGALGVSDVLKEQGLQQSRKLSQEYFNLIQNSFSGGSDSAGGPPRFIPGPMTIDPVRGPIPTLIPNPEFRTKQQQGQTQFTLDSLLKNSKEAVQLTTQLEESFLLSGTPLGGTARDINSIVAAVQSSFGGGASKRKQQIAARDRVGKLYGQILNKRVSEAIARGEPVTDAKLRQLQTTSPSLDKRPEANLLLLADFMEEELNSALQSRTPLTQDTINKVRKFISEARAQKIQTGGAPDINVGGVIDQAASAAQTGLGAAKDLFQSGVDKAKPVVASGIEQAQIAAQSVIDRLLALDFKGMSKEAKQRALDELSQIDPSQLSADAKAKAIELYDELYNAINK